VTAERWLAPIFLGELEPQLRASASANEAELETQLAAHVETGKLTWPAVVLADEAFARHLASVLEETDLDAAAALSALHAGDLYLACACAHGDPAAVAIVDEIVDSMGAPLRSTGLDAPSADDVKQQIREHLFVGAHGVPGIASYRGRGQLRSWMRAVAVRQAMLHFRKRRETPVEDHALEGMQELANDPQLAPWKEQYAAAFRVAFEHAIEALDDRKRTLLRQHHLDRLSIDALAKLYRVHRATAARWVAGAREELLAGVRERMSRELAIARSEIDSALRLARSQLDLSLHRLLGQRKT
jgi:RNA polymerase sigma-70 factor (ECF subfamily)